MFPQSMRRSYSLDRGGESRLGSAVAPTLRSAVAPTSISRGERQPLGRSTALPTPSKAPVSERGKIEFFTKTVFLVILVEIGEV